MTIRRKSLIAGLLLALMLLGALAMPSPSAMKPPANGVYAVLAEGGQAQAGKAAVVLPYQGLDGKGELREIALDTSDFVPLLLTGPPVALKEQDNRLTVEVQLQKKQAAAFEKFTGAHLGQEVAVVAGGEIVSVVKVRSVISDGKALITGRGGENAKELMRKLSQ
ncbi:MAG: hypothetical protein HY821_10455 [Acidobacteria bacterium]|nr:hypothetical protein [Acidobacteriota bacterium]